MTITQPDPAALFPTEGFTLRPRWETAVTERLATVRARRSWDYFRDVFSPTWDECKHDPSDCIAIACSFLEMLLAEPLDDAARRVVALGVRKFGKAYLFGLDQAVDRIDDPTDHRNLHRYATVVARRLVDAHREESRPCEPTSNVPAATESDASTSAT